MQLQFMGWLFMQFSWFYILYSVTIEEHKEPTVLWPIAAFIFLYSCNFILYENICFYVVYFLSIFFIKLVITYFRICMFQDDIVCRPDKLAITFLQKIGGIFFLGQSTYPSFNTEVSHLLSILPYTNLPHSQIELPLCEKWTFGSMQNLNVK